MITRIFALAATTTAMGMAAVSAWDRGGTGADRVLLIAVALVICAGAHLIPSLSQKKIAWLLWLGCLMGTLYGHVSFFTHASVRAGNVRAQSSPMAIGTAKQVDTVREALAGIRARPVTTVASELAAARHWQRRQALEAELAEARRAVRLQDDLVKLTATATVVGVTASENPVTSRIARVIGGNAESIELVIGIGLSLLLELTGALLWWEVLGKPKTVHGGDDPPLKGDSVAELREAVATGKCKPTVAGIREFLRCGQDRAMELRRQLFEQGSTNNNDNNN